ncbi:MAG TPA: sigma-70 family RNA polymerase sigma factor [Ilumatobacter sp.]|nr:sigma-70 family RNA polymerase sigma factor [Ilumatobacter sp.]
MTVVVNYETLFREWYPRLVSLGVTMTGRRDVASDAAQEAFLRAHRNWDVVSTYERPSAWVRKVAVNLLIDQQRASARERDVVDRLAAAPVADTSGPALTRWLELTRGLPDRQRQIVTLYYADDLAVADIAAVLDISEGAVKASLFKARAAIHQQLETETRDV